MKLRTNDVMINLQEEGRRKERRHIYTHTYVDTQIGRYVENPLLNQTMCGVVAR